MDAILATMTDLDDRRRQFAALLSAHQGLLRKLAWAYGRTPADRADLLQDMALQLWAVFPQWDAARPFATWAWRVALNVALAGARRAAARPVMSGGGAEHPQTTACESAGPESLAIGAELLAVLDALEPLNRALLMLTLEGLSYREIGEVLGLSESNVGVRLTRLKPRVRALLETSR